MVKKTLYKGIQKGTFYLSCPHPDWADIRARGDHLNQRICDGCEYCKEYEHGKLTICMYPKIVPEAEQIGQTFYR